MSTVIKSSTIPVFYHVPKNSGFYIINRITNSIWKHVLKNIRIIYITDERRILAQIVTLEEHQKLNTSDIKIYNLHISNLDSDFFKELSILAIFIEAAGFRFADNIINTVSKKIKIQFTPYKFITLREPFSRERSLYHYLTSDKSKYELTHGALKSPSFEQHIMSEQLQDSWLIRSLLNLTNNTKLTEEHFHKTCQLLQNFQVFDSNNADQAIKEALSVCFGIEYNEQETNAYIRNENIYHKMKFEQLQPEAQKRFSEVKKWDQGLYNFFIKKV
jgi:hypothetical protein